MAGPRARKIPRTNKHNKPAHLNRTSVGRAQMRQQLVKAVFTLGIERILVTSS
jgi:hypothetical protein